MKHTEQVILAFQEYVKENDIDIDTPEDLEKAMEEFLSFYKDGEEAGSEFDQAYQLLDQALAMESRQEAMECVERALEIYPDFTDAKLLKAELQETPWETIDELEKLEKEERQKLEKDDYFREEGFFWAIMETRPYIRILNSLVHQHMQCHQYTLAKQWALRLLELNHDDNTGIRFQLMGIYTILEQQEELKTLLEQYQAEDSVPGLLFTMAMYFKTNELTRAEHTFRELAELIHDWEEFESISLEELFELGQQQAYQPNTMTEVMIHVADFPEIFLLEPFLLWLSELLPENFNVLH